VLWGRTPFFVKSTLTFFIKMDIIFIADFFVTAFRLYFKEKNAVACERVFPPSLDESAGYRRGEGIMTRKSSFMVGDIDLGPSKLVLTRGYR